MTTTGGIKMKLHKIKWKAIVKLIIIKAWGGITWDKMEGGIIKVIKAALNQIKRKAKVMTMHGVRFILMNGNDKGLKLK